MTLTMKDLASVASTWPAAWTFMLRIPSGTPAVRPAGFPSSPVTVAETAAFAVAGTHATTAAAATATANSFLPDCILPPEKRSVLDGKGDGRFLRFKTHP